MYTTHTLKRRTWPQWPHSSWGCWSPIYCISLHGKILLHIQWSLPEWAILYVFFCMLHKMIRRRCAWLNRVYFVFTSLKARYDFLCTGSPGGGVVTWFLWCAFGKHLHLTLRNAYPRVTLGGTGQWKGEIRSPLEDICHLTVGHCFFSPVFTLNTQV